MNVKGVYAPFTSKDAVDAGLRFALLRAYLVEGEPISLNATVSAIAVGYRAKRQHTFRQIEQQEPERG